MAYGDLLSRCADAIRRTAAEGAQEESSATTLARFYREHEDVEQRYPQLSIDERCIQIKEDLLTIASSKR